MPLPRHPSGSLESFIAGSIDPTTGVFERTDNVEQQRLRTAHACERCRRRKVKCNGEDPCGRCRAGRQLCQYAPERPRRPRTRRSKKRPPLASESPPRTTSAVPSGSSDSAPPDPSTPASSDSSGVASDHQRPQAAPSLGTQLGPYAPDASSTQSSPAPAPHAPVDPEIPRPRSAIAGQGASSSGQPCNVSDEASSGTREAFARRRRPPPRPLDPMRAHESANLFPPFSIPIQTDRHHPALLQAFWGHSYSRTAVHDSDGTRTRTQGLLGGPYIPQQESGSWPTSSSDRSSRPSLRDVGSLLHSSPVLASHSSFQSSSRPTMESEDAPGRSISNPVSLSFFGRHVAATSSDLIDRSRRPPTPPRRF